MNGPSITMKLTMKPSGFLQICGLLSASLWMMNAAQAHIVLLTQKAEAGTYYKAVLQVGHGCEGSPTKEVVIDIPSGVPLAKPMPKAGWKMEIETAKFDTPYMNHGKPVHEYVKRVRWIGGPLLDSHYDEFVVVAKLPEQPGMLYWKTSQICEQGRTDWSEVPAEGKSMSDYKTPAAQLEVVPRSQHRNH
jgi:uncharacterized protein YcnI